MNDTTLRTLNRVLIGLLVLWGAFVTIQYFAVPVHQAAMLDQAGQTFLQTACEGRGWLCNGLLTIPATGIHLLGQLAPFTVYIVLSLLLLVAFLARTFLRDNEWRLRVTLSPLLILLLFVLSAWGIMMGIAYSNNGGLPMNRVVEPTAQVYPDVSAEGLQDLHKNFEELQASGCLSPLADANAAASVYTYRFTCIQIGFAQRVLSQMLLLIFIMFDVLVLGRALLHLMRLKHFPPLPEGVLSAGLGACALIALLWCVAMVGAYTSMAGWALLIGIPLAGFIHSRYWLLAAWNERWEVDLQPWNLRVILSWLLVSYLAFNFLNVVRPFPIGWDDLGRYLNQPRLLVSYGHFIPTIATFSWEYVTSLGFLLFGYDSVFGATLSMLINWSAGLLAVCAVWVFGRTYLGQGRGLLAALLYYTLPMVGHFSFADMKVDNAIFAVGALALFAGFLAVCPPDGAEGEEHDKTVLPLIALAGILSGFAFGMKPTSIMLIMALGAVIVGVRFGWAGFLGVASLAWAVFTAQGVFKPGEVSMHLFGDASHLSKVAVFITCTIVGFVLLGVGVRGRTAALRPFGRQIGIFIAAFALAVLPWLVSNNLSYGTWPPSILLSAANKVVPAFVLDDKAPPAGVELVRSLPKELQLDTSNPACVSTSKEEELDRYWGNYSGPWHYLGLPWRAVMNTDAYGYYVTLVPALLLFPLLLLLPYFWSKEGRWMRWMAGATLFMIVQWVFFANGIVWYGVGMFLGLVLGLEALAVCGPSASARRTTGVLLALSLLAAFSHRLWQFDTMQNIFEYPMGKVSAATMEERTIPHYNNIRDVIEQRIQAMPDRPYVYRMGTFIPYFLPKNFEVLPLADNQLDVFNCLYQERDAAKTLARLQALGFNSMIFDTNTQTIEQDKQGSLHKKVQAFVDFANTPGLGINVALSDPGAGIAFILLP